MLHARNDDAVWSRQTIVYRSHTFMPVHSSFWSIRQLSFPFLTWSSVVLSWFMCLGLHLVWHVPVMWVWQACFPATGQAGRVRRPPAAARAFCHHWLLPHQSHWPLLRCPSSRAHRGRTTASRARISSCEPTTSKSEYHVVLFTTMTSAYNLTSALVVSTGYLIFYVYVYIIDVPVVHLRTCVEQYALAHLLGIFCD